MYNHIYLYFLCIEYIGISKMLWPVVDVVLLFEEYAVSSWPGKQKVFQWPKYFFKIMSQSQIIWGFIRRISIRLTAQSFYVCYIFNDHVHLIVEMKTAYETDCQ